MMEHRGTLNDQLIQLRTVCRVPKLRSRAQTYQEEVANSVSHGVGLFIALIAAPLLFANALRSGEPRRIIAFGVYAATLVIMYAASMVYHGLPRGRAKFVCRIIDHGAIFLLIAGSYTPFMMGVLWGPWGWTLLTFVWTFALLGVVLTAISRVKYPTLSTLVYLMLGWMICVGAKPLWVHMNHWGLFWIAAGGFSYTLGVAFFAADRLRYSHLVWHVCVLIGSACHYISVALYAFPPR
ncbi:MAG TPA: hemolysin III family protein [Candidatus Krumholzibacteria bacterium]|nr:hemolysin III family protein [Candidatus Krumholzibacteria bacterium]